MGALLEDHYGTGHESNDNYISLVSGQPPNLQNQADCQFFSNFVGAALSSGIEAGSGCVYPTGTVTVNRPSRASRVCARRVRAYVRRACVRAYLRACA
jgi:hypothetical protein